MQNRILPSLGIQHSWQVYCSILLGRKKGVTVKYALKFFILVIFLFACGRDPSPSPAAPVMTPDDRSKSSDCSPVTSPVTRITDVIALINALPKPLSLDCLVSSLYRPLSIQATASVISAQPATSRDKPRIFLHNEGLFLSVVPGDHTLEFGETWQSIYSIKGELTFPITETLSDNAPFVQIGPIFSQSQNQTRCGAPCHVSTVEYSKQGGIAIFASQIVRPNPELRVDMEELKAAWHNCSSLNDPACRLYEALFAGEDPLSFEWSEDLPFF